MILIDPLIVFSTRGISIWLMLLKSVAPVHGTQWQTKHCSVFVFVFFNYVLFLMWKAEIMMSFYVELKQTLKCCETFKNFLRSYQNGAYICIVDILLWVTASDPLSLVIHEPVTTSGLQTRKGKASALFTTSPSDLLLSSIILEFCQRTLERPFLLQLWSIQDWKK